MRALAAAAVLAALVTLLLGGCSSSSPSATSSATAPATASISSSSSSATVTIDQACIDLFVNAMNTLDVSDINPIDGLDASEQARLDQQLNTIELQHPELGSGGRCHPLLDQSASLDDPTVQQIIGRLKPDVLAALSYRPH